MNLIDYWEKEIQHLREIYPKSDNVEKERIKRTAEVMKNNIKIIKEWREKNKPQQISTFDIAEEVFK